MIICDILKQLRISCKNKSDEFRSLQHSDSKLNIRKTQKIQQMNFYKNQIMLIN